MADDTTELNPKLRVARLMVIDVDPRGMPAGAITGSGDAVLAFTDASKTTWLCHGASGTSGSAPARPT